MNERDFGAGYEGQGFRSEWIVRAVGWVLVHWRPHLGWTAMLLCILLSVLPAILLEENRWLRSSSFQVRLNLLGPIAVVCTWAALGWRAPAEFRPGWLRRSIQLSVLIVAGALVITQLLGNWLPDPVRILGAATSGDWHSLGMEMIGDLNRVAGRYLLWWQGVQQESAARDDLVLAGIGAIIIWLLSMLVVWLARRTRQGLLAAVPILWPVGFVMLYSPAQRWLFVLGLGLALLLHLTLSQQNLARAWESAGLDYSPTLLVERAFTALAGIALVLALALLVPNLYIRSLSAQYYAWLAPMNERLEATGKRLFPGLTGVVPWDTGGLRGGLPNSFLLSGGRELGEREVMHVRTSEPQRDFDSPPIGHNLRGATFSDYDGRGWANLMAPTYIRHTAEEAWTASDTAGRRALLQNVNLSIAAQVIYAAGEPQAASVDYSASQRFRGDLISLNARAGSYAVISQIPALSSDELQSLPAWDADRPLPDEYAIYLDLPPTVTERTRALATELTRDVEGPFATAAAIEAYLRTFPYDLTIENPPEDVTDVADYFLFDLQRGYCDYYATAFVVLARLAGLPARFVTGFAPGAWLTTERQWLITEAEAHSWPEVYFPEIGWIAFEPTAGRPELVRLGTSPVLSATAGSGTPIEFEVEPPASAAPILLGWLGVAVVLIVLFLAGAFWWRRSHQDPWLSLLRWGVRAGHPMEEGETVIEYGETLVRHLEGKQLTRQDLARTAAREVRLISQDISSLHYAPAETRTVLRTAVLTRWNRLRQYLRQL